MVVESFLARTEEPAADWLLLIDSDMAFGPDTLEAFMAIADPDERPIVGGLAFRVDRFGRVDPCFAIHRPDETGKFLLATPESFSTDELLPVDATGAACLLVHRKVLEAVGEKFTKHAHRWFAEMQTEAGHQCKALDVSKSVSLTANAGSGKTFVLSQRFIEILLSTDTQLNQIAAITFTEKAAGELFKRISDEL